MLKLFISHAWEDNEITKKLSENLQQDGFETWTYYNKVSIGNGRLPETIINAIRWCDVFVLEWSKFSAQSKCVSLECQKAESLNKPIIACLFDAIAPSEFLSKFEVLNFTSFSEGYKSLIETMQSKKETIRSNAQEDSKAMNPGHSIFRNQAKSLSEDEVSYMLKSYNFFDKNKNSQGIGFDNQFVVQEINGFKVILDRRAGLMWQQSSSAKSMWFDQAKNFIERLNRERHAGYRDWRIPTLEEAMSLMRRRNGNGGELFLNSLFNPKQGGIWTSDLIAGGALAWVVFFNYGSCYVNCFDLDNYVLAVRSSL